MLANSVSASEGNVFL